MAEITLPNVNATGTRRKAGKIGQTGFTMSSIQNMFQGINTAGNQAGQPSTLAGANPLMPKMLGPNDTIQAGEQSITNTAVGGILKKAQNLFNVRRREIDMQRATPGQRQQTLLTGM